MDSKEINLNNVLRDFKPEKVTGGLIVDPLKAKVLELEKRIKILESLFDQKPLDPEYSKVVDDHFCSRH